MWEKIKNIFRSAENAKLAPYAGKKILLVEDGEVERKFLAKTLGKCGFIVFVAENGEKGIEIVRREKIDLAILDYKLPGMNGNDVCRVMKNDPQTNGIPVIFLTGSASSADLVECYEVGADYYLRKPISAEMLLKQIRFTFEMQYQKEPQHV